MAKRENSDGQGNCNLTRANAAIALANWLATDPTGSADPDFLISDDLYAYAMENPIASATFPPEELWCGESELFTV